ncbi:radical SAM protein [Sphingomonas sp. DG1-23]|uniref:B12-binding domain-containing radical SAM protein n=1 Tax=Sphingomonas sp. DG1-23 TaxID=3068316 RepID=UPI00273FD532|nr:radical SAM protein [Sphingomonas sp. DG1-23]MDP5279856.1 radical SAM protein [Sphingomonas sp. DG1-23]
MRLAPAASEGSVLAVARQMRFALDDMYCGPATAEGRVRGALADIGVAADVIVFGQYAARAAFVSFDGTNMLVSSGDASVADQIEAIVGAGEVHWIADGVWNLSDRARAAAIAAPRLLLVNPSFSGFDHIASPVLGLGLLVSFLRKHLLARVELLDFKLGASREDLIASLDRFDPQIVGISIDFDEVENAIELLELCQAPGRLLLAGNYLARLNAERLIGRFPELIVAAGEGENTMIDAVRLQRGEIARAQISGAIWRDPTQPGLRRNPVALASLDDSVLPAPDSVERLRTGRVAFGLELSRGCSYNACTFCPRDHKTRKWRAASVPASIEAIAHWVSALDVTEAQARSIYFVDEEFIGYSSEIDVTERLADFAHAFAARALDVRWEINTRVDQIVDPDRDFDWHARRWEALAAARDAGLGRILIGVESGSDSVLTRFVKGQTAEQAIESMRVLSLLRIDSRVTFITYDQMMSPDELGENFLFLGRRDALLSKPGAPVSAVDLQAAVENGAGFPSIGRVFEKVTYLHNEMKPLPDSHFIRQIARARAAENWTSTYRFPAIAIAAGHGARWMNVANHLTMLLLRLAQDRIDGRQRLRLMGRIHHGSYAVLGGAAVAVGAQNPAVRAAAGAELAEFGIALPSTIADMPDRMRSLLEILLADVANTLGEVIDADARDTLRQELD